MRTVGRYELVEIIGKGGMGEVWKAKDTALDRVVAIKLLQRTGREDLARFKREAHVTASLSHPNVAQLYEILDNPPAIAMQYVEGVSINEWEPKVGADLSPDRRSATRRSKTLLAGRVAALRDAARAVAYAHDKGVLHRDIKPDNILVDAAGRAFVLDFGLARESRADLTAMTVTGDILGTPSYMAPEQARGEVTALDARTDVYSLGATLYAVLTGRPPFSGPTAYDVILKVTRDDAAPPEGDRELAGDRHEGAGEGPEAPLRDGRGVR